MQNTLGAFHHTILFSSWCASAGYCSFLVGSTTDRSNITDIGLRRDKLYRMASYGYSAVTNEKSVETEHRLYLGPL